MSPKEIVDCTRAVLLSVETNLLDTNGQFKHQPDLADDDKVITDAETAYSMNGGVLTPQVSTVINSIVALMMTLGGFIH